MKYPMRVEEALVYERLLAEVYRMEIENGTSSRHDREMYEQKLLWISELRRLHDEEFEFVDADGSAWGSARPEDVEQHVADEVDLSKIDCNVYDYN